MGLVLLLEGFCRELEMLLEERHRLLEEPLEEEPVLWDRLWEVELLILELEGLDITLDMQGIPSMDMEVMEDMGMLDIQVMDMEAIVMEECHSMDMEDLSTTVLERRELLPPILIHMSIMELNKLNEVNIYFERVKK